MTDEKASAGGARSWTAPLERLDAAWTRLETWLCTIVLLLEIIALCVWVSLHGLSSPADTGPSGLVFRCIFTAVVLGGVTHLATRPRGEDAKDPAKKKRHDTFVFIACVAGLVLGRAWVSIGVNYWGNWTNWIDSASAITFFGGLRGLATRLTLWLALLGASLATAKGKHIHVDVLVRFVPVKLRAAVAIIGALAAATVCISGAAGFLDAIAINEFGTPVDKPCPGEPHKFCTSTTSDKIDNVKARIGRDMFLFGRQISLDFKTLPHVMKGEPFQGYLGAREWNEWLKGSDWTAHVDKSAVDGFTLPEDDAAFRRIPFITVPGIEPTRGLLAREGGFVLPFGLFLIGLRFVLRALLVVGGRVNLDPDAAHGDEELAHAHDAELKEAAAEAAAAEGSNA